MLKRNNIYIKKIRESMKQDLYGSMGCGAAALPW